MAKRDPERNPVDESAIFASVPPSPMFKSKYWAESHLATHGFGPITIDDEALWIRHGVEIYYSSFGDGGHFTHPNLDMIAVNRCDSCGRFDQRKEPARTVDEAIERGYLVRLTEGVHYPEGAT